MTCNCSYRKVLPMKIILIDSAYYFSLVIRTTGKACLIVVANYDIGQQFIRLHPVNHIANRITPQVCPHLASVANSTLIIYDFHRSSVILLLQLFVQLPRILPLCLLWHKTPSISKLFLIFEHMRFTHRQ